MRIKLNSILISFFFLFVISGKLFSQEEITLSLEECIKEALKNNLELSLEIFNPKLAEESFIKAKEFFLPRFELSYAAQRTENPSYWWIQGKEMVKSSYFDYSFSLIQEIPTGGNLSLSLMSYKSDTNQAFQLINPRYGSVLRFDFTQPLLRGFGFKVSQKEMLLARNNKQISINRLQSVLLDLVYRVEEAYWNLVYAIENHRVKKQSLELALDLLKKNEKEVNLGKLAPIELLNAETAVAMREADILEAEALIQSYEDLLGSILNLPKENDEEKKIIPLDKPSFEKRAVSIEDAFAFARENRPELLIRRNEIEAKELNLTLARNQLLPALDLRLSYWSPGISGDRILYLNDNPLLGIVVGKEKGSAQDSLNDALRLIYRNWSIALTLSLPLSTVITRAEYAKAKMEVARSQLELKREEKQVFLEIRNAVRELEINAKRVEALRLARELAEKRLEAEEKKLEVGLTTNYFVLQYQEELSTARSQELKAMIDYRLAWAKFEKACGISLEKRKIRFLDQDFMED